MTETIATNASFLTTDRNLLFGAPACTGAARVILKMPGGEGGEAYACLNELSTLISRQQHVIRQTHQHLQRPQEQETLQAQDRKKLSEAEADLGDSAQHLYAKMAGEMENK